MKKFWIKMMATTGMLGAFLGLSLGTAHASIKNIDDVAIAKIDSSAPLYLDQAKTSVANHVESIAWHTSHASHASHASHYSHRSSY